MGQDERWPILPFLIIRGVQTLFAIMILGMTAYILSVGTAWWAGMGLFISLVILIWMGINFTLFFLGMLLPLVVVIVDGFCFLFLLITMAGTADSGWLALDCSFYYTTTVCPAIKGSFAIELLAMFLFLASLVYASITLHKYRKDLFGRAHANSDGVVAPAANAAGLPAQISQAHKPQQQYQQQPQQMQYPQQPMQPGTTYPAPVYNTQQPHQMQPQQPYQQGPVYDGFVSPPTSPPPVELQHTGGYSNVSSVTPHTTGGWPAGAAEMPATTRPTGAELPN